MTKRTSGVTLEFLLKGLGEKHHCAYAVEFRFHPVRRWRFDGAFPERKIAVEIDGGAWVYGRHTRGKGFVSDQEKTNEAQLLGWSVYRFVPDDLTSGKFLEVVNRALTPKKTPS